MSKVIRIYLQPAFLLCTAVLAIAASSMSIAIKSLGVYLEKQPLPLKKSLDLLDENGLAPYRVISKKVMENEEMVTSLGTSDYIQWNLEDFDAPSDSSVRYCSLFITYYGLPDIILHVPEECYMGSGYQRLASDSFMLEIDTGRSKSEPIEVKHLVFAGTNSSQWISSTKFPVLYLFNTNGVYASNREDTRMILNRNIFGKFSYFCKVEWKFFNKRVGALVYPRKEETVTASQKLLSVILPVLEKEHWPVIRD
jgi:hypothetical protein